MAEAKGPMTQSHYCLPY